MPAQWTGRIVGELHNNNLTAKELAAEAGWNDKYLSQVLNSENPPKGAEQKLNDALNRLTERKKFEMHVAESVKDRKESK